MQYEIDLNNLPNQNFTISINDIDMEVNIRLAGEDDNRIMFFSLLINDEYICPNVPVFSNQGVLPYPYMVSEVGGNFYFITENDDYPNYENFGTTCKLYFLTEDELNG